jgi:DNA-binding CsgD family transcriptional regulator
VYAAGVLDRVERLCREPLDARTLRGQVVEVLHRSLPFDGHVWPLTDPVTGVGTSPHAEVPMLPWPDLPRLVRNRYVDPEHAWREQVAALGVRDTTTVALTDRFGEWGWLELWRCDGRFSGEESALLAALVGSLTVAVRNSQARTFVEDAERLPLAGPAVVLLDPGLDVVSQTSTAGAALRRLNPPGEEPILDPIPAAAINVGAALLAGEAGRPVGPPWSRVHLGGGCWVTLRAERLTDGGIAVTIETSTPAERREVFGLAHGLSPREREVLGHLATGAESRSIARTLVLSEHTVNDHVRSVLAKTGSATRQVLLSRIAGS